jgi:hypothetical protein
MHKIAVALFLLFPLTGLGQYVILGKVINGADKKPVADASVFLNNATVGTKTGDGGTFRLNNVRPGQYDLVVSIIGYQTLHTAVMVNNDISLPDLEISPKTILLKEVKIGPNRDWEKDYEKFKRLFLGASEFADKCKILNPHLLAFDYDPDTKIFSASTSDFLEIENNALGYKIKYLLSDFTNDDDKGILYFEGSASFEEMAGSKSEQRRWQKNRLSAYEGSSMHFLRSTITNSTETEGFKVLRLIRKTNPDYSISLKNHYIETLVNKPELSVNDFVKLTNVKGQFALAFKDCLYVMYAKKFAEEAAKGKTSTTDGSPGFLDDPVVTTVIFDAPYAFFDYNGIIINPQSILFNGAWGKSRIAELLPVDYVPF